MPKPEDCEQLRCEGGMKQQRLDGVDILRGLSILAVILLHIQLRMRFAGHSLEPAMPKWLFHLLFWNGNNGVQVFFAVSGFLITLTSIRRFGSLAGFQPWTFYRIRFARIAPLLLALLAVLSVLHGTGAQGYVIPPEKASLGRSLAAVLTFHFNWLEAERGYLPASWDVLWSLSVEEMFYLVYPIVCVALLRLRGGLWWFVLMLSAFVAMGPFARVAPGANEIWREKSYLGGMDAIALGCLTVVAMNAGWRIARLWEFAGYASLLWIAVWPPWSIMRPIGRAGLDGTILAVGACLVMAASVSRGFTGGCWSAALRWLGRHSYEIYLTHEFVVIAATDAYASWRVGPLALWFVLVVPASAALGGVVARWFSEPLNRKLRPATPASGSFR